MKKLSEKRLTNILKNNTSGSSEILIELHNHLKKEQKLFFLFPELIAITKKQFISFQNIQVYLDEMEKSLYREKNLVPFFTRYDLIFQNNLIELLSKAKKIIGNYSTFLTLSNSKTVLEVLRGINSPKRKIKIYVAESRPKFEGRILAKRLVKSKIATQLITEAMIPEFLIKSDAAIIGADIILKNGDIVNKVGSRSLAIICKELNKPIFVIADKKKFSNRNSFKQKEMPPEEIWRHFTNKIIVQNFYFERVEKELITEIISD